ncbi:MAG: GNAT family N-acetyltransferase [Nocardioides sp.]|uniref:GNAT family N-acetyltransferase n=1 Tax=Nocardioides sp. TaxID=35761 RepID=UPI003F08C05E
MEHSTERLPDGLTTRPLTRADTRAVYELMAAVQQAELGTVEIEEADIVADWARPSHDLTTGSVGVLAGDDLVGYAELVGRERYDAAVHPAYGGRGIGTWLAAWIRAAARSRGDGIVGMPVPEGSTGDRLLERLGYHVRWTSWVLQVPPGTQVPARDLPAGYTVGAAKVSEYGQLHDVLEEAFSEWAGRPREPWADFEASVLRRPGFAPWQLRVVRDPSGEVVAAAITLLADSTAYVDRLGVRRYERGRGLAQALLVDAFSRGAEHGATTSELATDTRTGALGLYRKVGMQVTSTWQHRAVSLTESPRELLAD